MKKSVGRGAWIVVLASLGAAPGCSSSPSGTDADATMNGNEGGTCSGTFECLCGAAVCTNGSWECPNCGADASMDGDASSAPQCPGFWSESYCGQPCMPVGLSCSYPSTGDALFCRVPGDAQPDASLGVWVCGV